MKNIKFGIFGCGVIASFHAAAIADVVGAELYACADVYPPASEKFAEKNDTE